MNLVEQSYKGAILASNDKRKELAGKKLDFYFNEQENYILAQIKQHYKDNSNQVLPVFVNAVKKIINLTSAVYVEDAQRIIDGSEQDKNIYATFEDTAALPLVMKQANRLTNLLGTTLLRPVFRRGRMELDLLTPDFVDITIGDSPNDVQSVMITHFSQNGRPNEVTYSLWTPETLYILDYNHKEIRSEPNPYGVLPFVVLHSSLPTNEFWLDGASNDLVNTQDALNLHLSSLLYTQFFQGHSVGWVKGGGTVRQMPLAVGPGSMISLPENAELGFSAPKADIANTLETIKFLLEQTAVQNGLPASVVTTAARELSGVALVLESTELSEARRDQMAIFARAEQELFALFRTVWNVHNPANSLSSAASLKVDFAEPQATLTAQEKLSIFEKEMELGLSSPIDYLLSKNPDYSRKDAQAKLLEVKDDLAEFNKLSSF